KSWPMYWSLSSSWKMSFSFFRSSRRRSTMTSARYQMPSPEGASGAGLPQTGAPRTDKTRISSRISGRSILVEIDGSAIGLLASPLQYFLPLLRVHFLGLGHRPPQGAFQVHLLPLVLIAPEQKSPVKFARWL